MSMIEAIESIGIPKSDVLRLVNMDSETENRKENNVSSKPDGFGWAKFRADFEKIGISASKAKNALVRLENATKKACKKYNVPFVSESQTKAPGHLPCVKISINNNWRKMHGLPLIRRRRK